MSLKLGSEAPNFEADTTEGRINFHDWIGDSWVVLFSHPKSFTPVCTTELGYMANIKPEFDKRNTKIIGLSVDSVDDNRRWASDIEETQGAAPNYPINWKQGEDVIIAGSVNNDQAKEIFGEWESPKPYIRIVPAPSGSG